MITLSSIRGRGALDILLELGIRDDASIFPLKRNHGGFPQFSSKAKWIDTPKGNRILEVAVTPVSFLGKKMYFCGGGYFRLSPFSLINQNIVQLNNQGCSALVYLHPREFDPKHPKLKMSFNRYVTSYINLHTVQSKFARLLTNYKFNRVDQLIMDHDSLSKTSSCIKL